MTFQCFSKACREVSNKKGRPVEVDNTKLDVTKTKRGSLVAKAICPYCNKKLSKFVSNSFVTENNIRVDIN